MIFSFWSTCLIAGLLQKFFCIKQNAIPYVGLVRTTDLAFDSRLTEIEITPYTSP